MQLFDTHAHMDDLRFDTDRAVILEDMKNHGIQYLMNIGCDAASSLSSVKLAETYPFVYAAVGSHPDDAASINEDLIALYRELCQKHPKVRAIGEIGLDYHYEDVPRVQQRVCFIRQMELARELHLPVIVHEREAHEDGLAIIKEFPDVTGVFHCYSGSVEMARELVKRGWYIGFTGVITFKNARRAVEVVEDMPLSRLLLETDCPYMAPEPYRGKRNDSRYLYRMAQRVAEIRNMDPEEVAQITLENGLRLFRITTP